MCCGSRSADVNAIRSRVGTQRDRAADGTDRKDRDVARRDVEHREIIRERDERDLRACGVDDWVQASAEGPDGGRLPVEHLDHCSSSVGQKCQEHDALAVRAHAHISGIEPARRDLMNRPCTLLRERRAWEQERDNEHEQPLT